MITSKKELNECIEYEHKQYCQYMFSTKRRRFLGWVKREPIMSIMRWQRYSRKADYYKYRVKNHPTVCEKIAYLFYTAMRNRLGEKIGIEVDTYNVGKGLILYHYSGGVTISDYVKIGKNCHLHGNNCIGNSGKSLMCPTIGDNVVLGVGAKIIGGVKIANNVVIAAGSVVVKDITVEGCTVAGVPSRIIKSAALNI